MVLIDEKYLFILACKSFILFTLDVIKMFFVKLRYEQKVLLGTCLKCFPSESNCV